MLCRSTTRCLKQTISFNHRNDISPNTQQTSKPLHIISQIHQKSILPNKPEYAILYLNKRYQCSCQHIEKPREVALGFSFLAGCHFLLSPSSHLQISCVITPATTATAKDANTLMPTPPSRCRNRNDNAKIIAHISTRFFIFAKIK